MNIMKIIGRTVALSFGGSDRDWRGERTQFGGGVERFGG